MEAGDELRDVYDDETIALLDRWAARANEPDARAATVAGWRRRGAAGALVTALALGIQEVLEPSRSDPIVEEVDLSGRGEADRLVTLLFVPDNPRATVAFVRPWLLRAS